MAGGLVAAGGLASLHRLGHTRKEPLGPGVPVPWLTPVGSFYVTAGKELPPLITEATTSLRVRSGGVEKKLPWEDLRALATQQVERTLLCDGAGFEIRSFRAPDNTLLHWNWRFAAIGNARWDCIPLDRLFDALGLPLKGPFVRAAARDTQDWFYPIETVRRGEILVAVGMNGAPLTHEHGAPARLVASGQYGRSALKWIVELSAGIEAYPTRDYELAGNHVHQVKPFVFASSPRSGSKVGRTVVLEGAAYAGATPVTEVIVINERAQQRHRARFIDPPQPFVWSRWRAEIPVLKGKQRLAIGCTDALGRHSEERSGRLPREPDGWDGLQMLEVIGG